VLTEHGSPTSYSWRQRVIEGSFDHRSSVGENSDDVPRQEMNAIARLFAAALKEPGQGFSRKR
jgi:hypothetical protein